MHVADASHLVVRDLPSQGLEGAFRVHLLPESLQQAGLKVGDVCKITSEDGSIGHGIAWRADDRMGNRPKLRPAKMTHTFRAACGFEEGSKVTIAASDASVFRADKILLTDITPSEYKRPDDVDDACWKIRIAHQFSGLPDVTEKLNYQLSVLLAQPELFDRLRKSFHVNEPILIHGYEGTGKSTLLNALADCAFKKVLRLDKPCLNGGSLAKNQQIIRDTFADAKENEPSIILMDDLEKLAPHDDVAYAGILGKELDAIHNKHIMVVAATRVVADVQSVLIQPPRFDFQIELPIPDVSAREQILNVLRRKPAFAKDSVSSETSIRTHGFTGKDLAILHARANHCAMVRFRRAIEELTMDRSSKPPAYEQAIGASPTPNEPNPDITLRDFEVILASGAVKPAALREFFTEKPSISWADIGGSSQMKESFDRSIGWTLKHEYKDQMAEMDLSPPKGVLLYGPPGCSKTLTAQAVANCYNLNFIAIKGAELISMYVGESERAIREVFRKARAASPCVIFFDEIDSIGSDRDSGTKGLNVVSTLLNEMDGFETLKDVFILAATNKPEILDPALIRPGRFDKLVFVRPPNDVARQEILMIATRKVSLSADIIIDTLVAETEGYSGAEIKRICHVAKEIALQRWYTGQGEARICASDFEEALHKVKRGISPEMLAAYEAFESGAKA
ncbi:uncharacterized protein MYCFIDRAFT_192794 [Pseudocercospora fijiensis CIRAD86]|uniref:AAA+ ATPase domain-containing protein n=1 Tax=Pseudocercospora fijiensis (strain CIRAD86) TaxID=383855 RepID=N1Q7L0_PSEFD|nr:uncharacterized protein MYCFIDRAFT_192794 [Pseudocercospora fijiensis CIRAD86]EME88684.1 hypothetical protein MYCFIDRAFT_192794 [Pseudocercospora fijiensis CIRAD86]